MEGAELEFTDAALEAIADMALERDTGARGLRAIVESLMLDLVFELPDHPPGGRYVVTEDVVRGRKKLFPAQEVKQKTA